MKVAQSARLTAHANDTFLFFLLKERFFVIARLGDVEVNRYRSVTRLNYWEKRFRDEILYSDRTTRSAIGLALMLNYWYSQKGCRINCTLRVMLHNQMRRGVVYEHRCNPVPYAILRRIIANYCKRLRAIKLTYAYFVINYASCNRIIRAIFATRLSFAHRRCSRNNEIAKTRRECTEIFPTIESWRNLS